LNKRISRRCFLASGGTAAAILAGGGKVRAAPRAPSPVYSAYHEQMVSGSTPDTVQYQWVRAGVDACLKAMTGQASAGDAWESLFAGIGTQSKVAIKVNCLNTDVHPQFATVRALVESMTEMLGGTFPAGNISLFDNNLWTTGKVDACYGGARLDALGIVHGEDSYPATTTVMVGGTSMYVSRFWAEADYAVSLAKMAPHQYYAGGLSGVIKNMMGAVSLANDNYQAKRDNSGFHDGAPYTAFRDLFANWGGAHLQLYIVDMLFACRHENAAGWERVVKRITMGRDPVAVDSYNVDKINELGMNVVQPVTKAVPQALEQAGLGSVAYDLVEPEVALPQVPSRDDIDALLRARMQGQATDGQVREQIGKYREQ